MDLRVLNEPLIVCPRFTSAMATVNASFTTWLELALTHRSSPSTMGIPLEDKVERVSLMLAISYFINRDPNIGNFNKNESIASLPGVVL